MSTESAVAETKTADARIVLDAWVREIIEWHFSSETGCPFWLDWAQQAGWDPREKVLGFSDLVKFPHFEDEWLRGGPVRRWVPRAYADRPAFVFETGGTTGITTAWFPAVAARTAPTPPTFSNISTTCTR